MPRRKIILKKNTLSGSIPTPSELSIGELAINTADGTIYTKLNDGTISIPIGSSGGTGGGVSIVSWNSITGKPSAFTPSVHSHNISDITGLAGILTAKADSNNPVFTGTVSGITKVMVGLSNVDNTSDINKPVSSAQASANENIKAFSIQRSNHTGTQPISSVVGLQTALDNKQNAGSYATLVNGLIPSSQLPSFVDDVLEYESLNLFPNIGSTGKIYVATDTNKTYRWTGSIYIEISASPGSTDSVPEGSVNKYYTDTRASAAAPVQNVAGRVGNIVLTKNDVGLNNVDNTSDINKPVNNATQNALNLKANINNPTFTGTVGGITKNMIGLSNVDNTADLEKPVSAAQAAAHILLENNITTKADAAQAYAIQRSNHTGIQPINSIDGLQLALDNKAPASHRHSIGIFNTAIGENSLLFSTTGERNTAAGFDSMTLLTTGFGNTGIGSGAVFNLMSGSYNTAVGTFSQISNISGTGNVSIGYAAGVAVTTGIGNCILGTNGGTSLTTGTHNIGIGYDSIKNNTTGSYNICIGLESGSSGSDFINCICLGTKATALKSGELVIGNDLHRVNTFSTIGSSGSANLLPARPLGYLEVRLNSELVRIPYYRA